MITLQKIDYLKGLNTSKANYNSVITECLTHNIITDKFILIFETEEHKPSDKKIIKLIEKFKELNYSIAKEKGINTDKKLEKPASIKTIESWAFEGKNKPFVHCEPDYLDDRDLIVMRAKKNYFTYFDIEQFLFITNYFKQWKTSLNFRVDEEAKRGWFCIGDDVVAMIQALNI